MSGDQQKLISALSSSLQPVRPVMAVELTALLWLLASAGFVVAVTHWLGPIRPNAIAQLGSEARFAMETLVGVMAIAVVAIAAFRASIPGALTRRFAALALCLMLLWLANYVIGLVSPALEPSMLGKRDHCFVETLVFSMPPALLALLLIHRRYPLRPVYGAALACLAAGMMPALYMQIACMYVPAHILQMHILPGLLVMLAGALAMLLVIWLRRNQGGFRTT
jgi:hypothetical protein